MAKKRVCEICGTVFDENRDVCPLCDTPYQADLDETQVFSAAELEATAAAGKKKKQKKEKPLKAEPDPEPGWKVAIAVLLSVLLLVFGAFIAYEFLIGSPVQDGSVACAGLYLSSDTVSLHEVGDTYYLTVSTTPADTTDALAYASSDETVATVDTSGKISAIASGEAIITVTCGQYSATCTVTCAGGSAASGDAGSTGGTGTASGDRSATSSDAGDTGDAGNADDTGSDTKTP